MRVRRRRRTISRAPTPWWCRPLLLALGTAFVGCASTSHSRPATAPATTATRPASQFRRTSTLLDFETPTDTLFLSTDPATPLHPDPTHAHTGHSSLLLPKGTRHVSVKLSSLLSGRTFPGTWTLAGPYLFTTAPTPVTVTLLSATTPRSTRTVSLPPNTWTPALLDLTPLNLPPKLPGDFTLTLDFPTPLANDAWLDDLLLADNTQTLVDPSEGLHGDDGWSLRREGFSLIGQRPAHFRFQLPTEAAAGGWHVDEANRVRAVFRSTGPTKTLTVYYDGRSYWDGQYKPMGVPDGNEDYEAQHLHPAAMTIPEDQGRPDRNTPGDANHDGYNETTASYEIVAFTRKLEVTLTPRTDDGLLRPVLDVKNLPPGDVRATLEGALAADVLRLGDDRTLIILPARLLRQTTLSIRVR